MLFHVVEIIKLHDQYRAWFIQAPHKGIGLFVLAGSQPFQGEAHISTIMHNCNLGSHRYVLYTLMAMKNFYRQAYKQGIVYNHWTGMVEWNGGIANSAKMI